MSQHCGGPYPEGEHNYLVDKMMTNKESSRMTSDSFLQRRENQTKQHKDRWLVKAAQRR